MSEEIKVPGTEVPAGAQVPGVGGDEAQAEQAAPTVSPEVAAEVAVAEEETAQEEPAASDPMQPVDPS